jgi:nuclear transport factor 2 (NTF2) superfamily protein
MPRNGGVAAAPRLPDDPAAFVAAAERITNERAAHAVRPLYAADAVFEAVTDGAISRAEGRDRIVRTWELFFAFLAARDFRLTKRLLLAADGVVVNEWKGSLAGRTHAVGIEVWRFDDSGLISEHTLYSYLNARPATSILQRLRLLVAYPLTALAFLRAELRAGWRRSSHGAQQLPQPSE